MIEALVFAVVGVALLIVLRRVNARRCKVFTEEEVQKLGNLADKEEE